MAFNTARLHSGTVVNIVPDHAVVELGYRPLPGMSSDDVADRLRRRVLALYLRSDVRLTVTRRTPSLLTPEGTPLQGLLTEHAAHPQCGACSFATDGGQLARLGAQPLVFGPGSITVAHKADEYIQRSALHHAVDVLESIIRKACT